MKSDQLKIFQDITLAYFSKMLPQEKPPVLQEPYLQFGTPVLRDYTSVVAITGAYEGCLYLTTTPGVLDALVIHLGEAETSENNRLDMCRELSNVLAGNASHAFGAEWTISVPRIITAENTASLQLPPSTFIMPFLWKGFESFLVVGLQPKE